MKGVCVYVRVCAGVCVAYTTHFGLWASKSKRALPFSPGGGYRTDNNGKQSSEAQTTKWKE